MTKQFADTFALRFPDERHRRAEYMLGANWTERKRQRVILAVAVAVLSVAICVTVVLLGLIDRQLKQNSEQQVVTFTEQAAGNVADRMYVLQNAIGAFTVQTVEPADAVADALQALRDRFGFSDVAFATVDGAGVYADGSPFAISMLTVTETALSEGRPSYSSTFTNRQGVRVRTAQRPLYVGGQLVGALYVQIPLSRLSMPEHIDMFDGRGYFMLIDADDGEILVPPSEDTVTTIGDDATLYDFLDAATDVPSNGVSSELLLSLQEGTSEVKSVQGIVESGESGLVIMMVDGLASYVCVAPVAQGEWYACSVVPVENVRAEAWGVMTAFQVVFVIVLLCLAGVALLVFMSYRKHLREKNVAMLSGLYRALSETLDMAVNLYSPIDHAVTPIVAKAACIVGCSMADLLDVKGPPADLGISSEGLRLFERIRAGSVSGIEQGEFSVDDARTGKRRWVAYAVNELTFDDKRQILVVLRDATAEKELQLSMKEAMTAAEAANQAKSDFLSRMSHEIRTPMNVIIGMLQIALNNVDNPQKTRDNLAKIGKASGHLLSLINDVLDISKIESGRMVLSSEPFCLGELVDQTEAVIRPQCEQKEQQLCVHLDCDSNNMLVGDAVRLQQMLVNLLTNAVKYTPREGRIELSVDVEPGSTVAYRCVRIVVADNGIGMSDDFKEHLFEPFYMEGRSSAQGTGLGMAIVKNIVTMLGGDIQVSSELNKGTSFTVTLNLREAFESECRDLSAAPPSVLVGCVESDSAQSAVQDCGDDAAPSLQGVRVLLAEDNDLNAEIARELLADAGMAVDWACDGREACRMFAESAEGTYDIVLMDVQMPQMNGYEATRAIRDMDREDACHVPIVAMSANAFADDVNASLDSGMDDHLSKPIDIGRVLSVIARQVGRARSRADGVEER